ncbi:very short patch repair endonuclease [Micromonospora sp. NPDC004540]|uniref:very short patch repair endonuclease n=1 Tax=Micromonospora sp. NPDC004540 TaxID=3154457 RepID=UPI0033B3DF76
MRGRMQRQRTRDTQPELAIRRLLHAAGLRYRIDVAPTQSLRRRADIVFGPARVAVFVDGCFWHGCPKHGSRKTKTNTTYWSDKVARNQARDATTDDLLTDDGWLVIRVWEHEDPREAAERIASSVHNRRKFGGHLP